MSIDPNWVRWIKSSSAKWFSDRISDNLFFYLETQDRRTMEHRSYVEFRIDGPLIKEVNKNYWHLDLAINVLIVTIRNNADLYEHDRNVGLVAQTFTSGIPVYCYGDTPADNPAIQLGCMLLIPDSKEKIIVSNYGQVRNDSRMIQSTVEGHYRLHLSTG